MRKEAEEETRGKEWKVKVIERAGIKSGASWNPTFVQSTSTSGTNHVLA